MGNLTPELEYERKKIAKIAKVSRRTVSKVIRNFNFNLYLERREEFREKKGARSKKFEKKVLAVINKSIHLCTWYFPKKPDTLSNG